MEAETKTRAAKTPRREIDKRELQRRLLDATAGPDALTALRRVVLALTGYVSDADVTAAVGAVLRIHAPQAAE